MSTSGESVTSIVGFIAILALFGQVAFRMLPRPLPRRAPWASIAVTLVVGVPSILQFVYPALTTTLARNPVETLEHGQWWRVITAILVQDGGPPAAIFNLLVVAGVTIAGEWVWGRWRMIGLFVVPSIILNLLAIGWGRPGGGSSFADLGLAMSVIGLALLTSRRRVVIACCCAAILLAAALIVTNDAHGVAALVGVALGLLVGWLGRKRNPLTVIARAW